MRGSDARGEERQSGIARRGFLILLGWVSLVLTALGATLAGLRFMWPTVFFEPPAAKKVGRPSDFAEDNARFLEEMKVYVFRSKEEGFYAVSAVCTHLSCTVAYEADKERFFCPCHGSVFDMEGNVASGPAPSPLPFFQVSVAPDGQLVVDKRRVVSPDVRLNVKV